MIVNNRPVEFLFRSTKRTHVAIASLTVKSETISTMSKSEVRAFALLSQLADVSLVSDWFMKLVEDDIDQRPIVANF